MTLLLPVLMLAAEAATGAVFGGGGIGAMVGGWIGGDAASGIGAMIGGWIGGGGAAIGDAASGGGGLTAERVGRLLWGTLVYVSGVAALALALALPAAYLTVMVNFPYRRLFVWLLFLPFALPPYLTAYVYGYMTADFGLYPPPLLMAIAATALATYPYIYFMLRYALRQQHCHIQSAGRLLGCSQWSAMWRISLPLAKPAIMVGLTLVILESLNDIAIAEFFGVRTIGIAIYDLWLNRNDFGSGARLAVALMVAVYFIVRWEEKNRQKQKQFTAACDKCYECERAPTARGWRRAALIAALLVPVIAGFVAPVAYLVYLSQSAPAAAWTLAFRSGLGGSLALALGLVALLLCIGVVFVMDKRLNKTRHFLSSYARIIYAMPGAVLAQGVFVLAAATVAVTSGALSLWTAAGGFAMLMLACCARFFIVVGGALEVGMDKISDRLDDAAKLAAMNPCMTFLRVHLPLLRAAVATVAVLVFLEVVKELPMTLILRPFNFDTLSTIIYQYASDEDPAPAAPAALILAALAAAAVSLLFALEGRDSKGEN